MTQFDYLSGGKLTDKENPATSVATGFVMVETLGLEPKTSAM